MSSGARREPALEHLPFVAASLTSRSRGGCTAAGAAMMAIDATPDVVVADAGYWHQDRMERLVDRGIQVLIPPDSSRRKGARPSWVGGLYAFMRRVLETQADQRFGTLHVARRSRSARCQRSTAIRASYGAYWRTSSPTR
jgi:Transposase DDE domain